MQKSIWQSNDMKNLINSINNLWKELGRSIFTGERYKANLRGLAFGSALIIILSALTGYMNLSKGFMREATTAILGIISGLFALYFTVVKKDTVTNILDKLYAALPDEIKEARALLRRKDER